MKDTIVYIFDGLADWEIGLITYELRTVNQRRVRTAAATKDPITTGGGLRVLPDLTLDELHPETIDLLILPGGEMWNQTFNEPLADLVRRFHQEGVLVAGICAATMFLAKTGLFDGGIRHTSNGLDYLQYYFPDYRAQDHYADNPAVSDQGVITASGNASHEFAYHILKTLGVYDADILAEFADFWRCRGV